MTVAGYGGYFSIYTIYNFFLTHRLSGKKPLLPLLPLKINRSNFGSWVCIPFMFVSTGEQQERI